MIKKLLVITALIATVAAHDSYAKNVIKPVMCGSEGCSGDHGDRDRDRERDQDRDADRSRSARD